MSRGDSGSWKCPLQSEAQAAITGLNGKDLKGRTLNVNEAKPRSDRGGGGGFDRRVVAVAVAAAEEAAVAAGQTEEAAAGSW